MKSRKSVLWTVILACWAATSAAAAGYGATEWGMSRAQVREAVGGLKEQDGMLLATDDVAGRRAMMAYVFTEADQLARVTIVFTKQNTNRNMYLADYRRLSEKLTAKYGEPTEDSVTWLKDLYRDDPDDYGMAIAVGHLVLMSGWELEGTDIQLMLRGGNYKVMHLLEYRSPPLAKALQQEKASREADDL